MIIRKIGKKNPAMFYMRGLKMSLQSIAIGGILETMGPIERRDSIFETMRNLMVMRKCETKRTLRSSKFSPKTKYCAIGKVNFREPLNSSKAKFRGSKSIDGFKKMKANVEQKDGRKRSEKSKIV